MSCNTLKTTFLSYKLHNHYFFLKHLLKEEFPNIVEGYNKLKNISVNSNGWTNDDWDKVQKEGVVEKLKDKKKQNC
jgi:hypothetical protein